MQERRHTEANAKAFETRNPSTTVIMRKSNVYRHFDVVSRSEGLHSVRRSQVPTSVLKVIQNVGILKNQLGGPVEDFKLNVFVFFL